MPPVAQPTVFRGIIEFLAAIGIYDVVLPFLLVFTIVFAILEKTKVYGSETINDITYTKKNLNSMTAFVAAFVVVASSRLVATINEALGNIVILLLLSITFLLLVGSFMKETKEGVYIKNGWERLFMVMMFIGVVVIFLHAIRFADGQSFLEWFWWFLQDNWNSNAVGSLILIIGIILYMTWITKDEHPKGASHGGGGDHGGGGHGGH